VHERERDLAPPHLADGRPGGEHVGAAHEVAAEHEPAGRVDEHLALVRPTLVAERPDVGHDALGDELVGPAERHEPELAHGDHELGDEGVVRLDDADVARLHVGHLVGLLRSQVVAHDARQDHQVAAVAAHGVGLVGRAHAPDPDGLLPGLPADLERSLLAREDEGAGALGVHAGLEQAQEGRDDPA